jgi:hypothetical protein
VEIQGEQTNKHTMDLSITSNREVPSSLPQAGRDESNRCRAILGPSDAGCTFSRCVASGLQKLNINEVVLVTVCVCASGFTFLDERVFGSLYPAPSICYGEAAVVG